MGHGMTELESELDSVQAQADSLSARWMRDDDEWQAAGRGSLTPQQRLDLGWKMSRLKAREAELRVELAATI